MRGYFRSWPRRYEPTAPADLGRREEPGLREVENLLLEEEVRVPRRPGRGTELWLDFVDT
jgi:hypothetical protein